MNQNMQIKIETEQAPKAIGPYSQAIKVPSGASLVFVSGQLPIDPATGKLIDGDIKALTTRVIDNLEAILTAGGSSLDKVVRTDVFLKNLKDDFALMNEIYALRFKGSTTPARQTIEVQELPLGSRIEISCIAIVN